MQLSDMPAFRGRLGPGIQISDLMHRTADRPGVKQTFGRNLHAVIPGLRPMRPRNGNDRWRGYQGVALR